MKSHFILIFASFSSSFSEWILLPSVFPKKNGITESTFFLGNTSNENICPDFHNLTAMSYASPLTQTVNNISTWAISLEDFDELLRQNQHVPKTSQKKVQLVRNLEENLMMEAERRIRKLFGPSREGRTTHIHSPSMESALMTISMLLFGVFLSKLILKLLLSHYNRYNGGVMTMMSGIRRPIAFAHGRKERSLQSELQRIQLMNLVDKYNSRFN